jgi:hypothetical protein
MMQDLEPESDQDGNAGTSLDALAADQTRSPIGYPIGEMGYPFGYFWITCWIGKDN